MHKGTWLLLTALMLAFGFAPARADQYYQYRDANGVMRYTDDLAAVPLEQRDNMKTHRAVAAAPDPMKTSATPTVKEAAADTPGAKQKLDSDASWKELTAQRKKAAEELDHIQAELSRTFRTLQNESNVLAAKEPSPGASDQVIRAYRRKVDALNEKIGRYESRLATFREKEADFRAQYRP
jgi:DNA repair ATPase RecN